MLTQEQTKSLKKGDKIVHEIRFIEECGDYIKCSFAPLFITDKATFLIDRACVSLPSYHKTVIDARDIFRNMSEGEKAMVDNFLSSYFRETEKQAKMRNALKKMGVELTNIRQKHDPCRLFKKGDKVRVVERNGRKFWDYDPKTIYTVVANEYPYDDQNVLHRGCVGINDGNPQTGSSWNIPFFYLELVTPVEELVPYTVDECGFAPTLYVRKNGKVYMAISYKEGSSLFQTREEALAAAEAECKRLNDEWRKEQK